MKSYVSAIKAVLREDGIYVNEDKCLLSSLTKACKYENDHVRTRLPICTDLLQLILNRLDTLFVSEQPYLVSLYKALFATAYFGLFGVGELTESQHAVKVLDVQIGRNKDKMQFILRTLKTHWKDTQPQIITITALTKANKCKQFAVHKSQMYDCPFQLLRNYIQHRKPVKFKDEQLFVFRDHTPVKASHMRIILRAVLEKLGLNPSLYGCHSMRIGRAMDMLNKLKLDVGTIKKLGHWKSNIVYSYQC